MRIHRVRLANYRDVADNTVEFPTAGVTIIEGANEIGKTCIPQAIDLILGKRDSSQAKSVKDAKPVHRDEAPEVEIELSSGDYRFVYWKRWLRRPRCTLAITAPRSEQLTGREAHDRVEAILAETLDAQLWRALRIEQGAELELPTFNTPSLGRALDLAAGGAVTRGEDDDLWERITERRDRYWTATGKVKGERRQSGKGVEEAGDEVDKLERRLRDIEGDVEKAARLDAERPRLVAFQNEREKAEQDLTKQRASADRFRNEVSRLEMAHREKEAQLERITDEQRRRQELVEDVDARRTELVELEAEAQQAVPALEAARRLSEDAQEAREKAYAAWLSAEEERSLAVSERDHYRRRNEVALLRERYERALIAQEALVGAEAHLGSAKVDDHLSGRIENAHLALVRAEAAAKNAAVSVETTAEADVVVRIGEDRLSLAAGETASHVVTDQAEVVLPGVVRVRIQAGAESKNLLAELAEARREYERLCCQGGVGDLAGAQRKAEERRAAERRRGEAAKTIRQELGDLTVEVLRQKIDGLTERVDRHVAERVADQQFPPDIEAIEQITVERSQHVTRRQAEYDRSKPTAVKAEASWREAELARAELRVRIENAISAREQAERRLTDVRSVRSDADLEGDRVTAQIQLDTARHSLAQANARLEDIDPDSLEARLENAAAARKRAVAALRDNEHAGIDLRSSLSVRGEEGLHTLLENAKSRLHHLRRGHESTESRARAALLLYTTFAERRQEARRRYRAPLRERIEALGRIVFGPDFGVELGDDLEVTRRTLDGVTLDVDHLSAGAREQLGLLSRLACAIIVSPDGGGAPVIIDDALGWSDPDRLERVGAAIASAGRQCQIVILTCTPGRYAHVGSARVIRLPT